MERHFIPRDNSKIVLWQLCILTSCQSVAPLFGLLYKIMLYACELQMRFPGHLD